MFDRVDSGTFGQCAAPHWCAHIQVSFRIWNSSFNVSLCPPSLKLLWSLWLIFQCHCNWKQVLLLLEIIFSFYTWDTSMKFAQNMSGQTASVLQTSPFEPFLDFECFLPRILQNFAVKHEVTCFKIYQNYAYVYWSLIMMLSWACTSTVMLQQWKAMKSGWASKACVPPCMESGHTPHWGGTAGWLVH